MLAAFKASAPDRIVQMMRERHIDRIDRRIGEERAIVAVGLRADRLRDLVRPFRVLVADRDDPGEVGRVLEAMHVRTTDQSEADHSEADLFLAHD